MKNNKLFAKEELLVILEKRFQDNPHRHRSITWQTVLIKLKTSKKIESLIQMELTYGEPDVVGIDDASGKIIFMDCAQQSPKTRRRVCYDQAAWDARKEFKPKAGNAVSLAEAMGTTLLNEEQYHYLQSIQDIDTTTSSWVLTPKSIRSLGGALFGDKRFGRAFIFHNGADSYYADRGFRTIIYI